MPKKGDGSNPSNYRPIALLSSLSEAFEIIFYESFLKHLSSFNFLSDHQYGFSRSTLLAIFLLSLLTLGHLLLSSFGETFSVALDTSKTFDSGTNPYYLNYPATDSTPPSVLLPLASFLADLFKL